MLQSSEAITTDASNAHITIWQPLGAGTYVRVYVCVCERIIVSDLRCGDSRSSTIYQTETNVNKLIEMQIHSEQMKLKKKVQIKNTEMPK